MQTIKLAEHAEAYIQQQQRKNQRGNGGSVNTKSGLENRPSKRRRIEKAKGN